MATKKKSTDQINLFDETPDTPENAGALKPRHPKVRGVQKELAASAGKAQPRRAQPLSRKGTREKYESWKGIDGLKRAEGIRERLRVELAREPRKKDFIDAGYKHVWQALYRHGRKTKATPNLEDIYIKEIRPVILQTKNRKLLEKILRDIINNLGPERTGKILRAIRTKRGCDF